MKQSLASQHEAKYTILHHKNVAFLCNDLQGVSKVGLFYIPGEYLLKLAMQNGALISGLLVCFLTQSCPDFTDIAGSQKARTGVGLNLLCSFTGGHLILQRRKYCNYWWVKGQSSNCAFWKPQILLIYYTWGFFPLLFPAVLSEQSLQRLLFSLYHKHHFLLPSGHHQSKERYTSVLLSGTQMFGICALIPLNSFNVR